MNWAFWGGTVILVISVTGLFVLRSRPVKKPTDRQTREIMDVFMSESNAELSAYDLKQLCHMPSETLYPILTQLQVTGLLESRPDPEFGIDGSATLRLYRLTDQGVAEAQLRGGDSASGKHRA
jgi:hypothetical protein